MSQRPLLRRFLQPQPWKWDAWILTACVTLAGLASIRLGQDANWDLQNYHYYNPWAFLTGRIYTRDIVAAQLQTFHNPLLDIPFYYMVAWDLPPRAIAFLLAVPAGIASFFLIKLLVILFGDVPRRQRWLPMGAALVMSLSSAMAIAVLGTTMNEWPGTALTIAAVFIIIRALQQESSPRLQGSALLAAGFLCGLATGAKLTFGVYAVGLCVAILLRGPWQRMYLRRAMVESLLFGVAVLAGTAVTAGFWMSALWTHYQNPIFPYANIWFKSPWWVENHPISRSYGPHNLGDWLRLPFKLASPPPFFVAEPTYTDYRLPVLYGVALLAAAARIGQRIAGSAKAANWNAANVTSIPATWRLVGLYWIVSFLLWTELYSIYRYLVPLELLSGALLIGLLRYLVRPGLAGPVFVVASMLLLVSTSAPDWARGKFHRHWFDITVPSVAPNALVLLTSDAPMAYVLPHFPADSRHIGINNNINRPELNTLMEKTAAQTIRAHDGPIYSLSFPAGAGAIGLAAHHLRRSTGKCEEVRTNFRDGPLELCLLERIPE